MDGFIVTVDGGGNLPPALGIAREIVRRGGTARFLGHEPQRRAVEGAGFRFTAVHAGRPYDAAAPRGALSGLRDLTAVFADRGIGADAIRAAVGELLADGPHRTAAAELGADIRRRDGAVVAVDLLEAA
jgi:UDP:flavonoid glycosyltransferase YjiC (YdhE family)